MAATPPLPLAARVFVESLANKPAPSRVIPIQELFVLPSAGLHKVRVAGRLLAHDDTGDTGWVLLASHDGTAAVWVDLTVCAEGAGGLLGVLAKEGLSSCWMATGDLEEVMATPSFPASLPAYIAARLEITPDRVLRAILMKPVDDATPSAGAFNLKAWEEMARVKSRAFVAS